MDEHIIDEDELSLERKSLLPKKRFFQVETVEDDQREQKVEAKLTDADTVVIADPDADGLACVALIRETFDEGVLIPTSPHDLKTAFAMTGDYLEDGARLFVCDLCPDSPEDLDGLEATASKADRIQWFDHHQWEDSLVERVEDAGVDLTVGESDQECTADVAIRELDADFSEKFEDLTAVTRDHDLWIRDDPRSKDIADLAFWMDPDEYIMTVCEHGADLPADAEQLLKERRIEKDALIRKAIERAEIREIGPWSVALTYGRCSQNEVAEAMREQGADAAVIIKPSGSASLRGTENFERCHEVAGKVNGGGHPRAAGCKPQIYDDMLDYAHHWTTRGAVAKQVIVEAFRQLDTGES